MVLGYIRPSPGSLGVAGFRGFVRSIKLSSLSLSLSLSPLSRYRNQYGLMVKLIQRIPVAKQRHGIHKQSFNARGESLNAMFRAV